MLLNHSLPPPDNRRSSLKLIALCLLLLLAMFSGLDTRSMQTASATNNPSTSEAQKLLAEAETLRAAWTAAQLREAIQKYDLAAQVWTSVGDPSSAALATLQAGDVCLRVSEFREALKRYESAATTAEKIGDRMIHGRALSKSGRVNSYIGNNEFARTQLTTALTLLQIAENDTNPVARSAYGEALTNMAEVTYAIGYLSKTLAQLEQARKFLDQDQEGQARLHLFRAYTEGSLGDAQNALAEADVALKLYQSTNNKTGEGLALIPRATFYAFEGEAQKGTPLLRKALEIFRLAGDRHSEAIAQIALGQAYDSSDRQVALNYYENGLRLFESVGALDHVAGMTFKLATMYLDENPEKAHAYYDRCLALSRAGGKLRNEANALSEIALVYTSQNRPEQAAEQHRKAQEFYKKIGDVRGQTVALNRYGDYLLLKLGQKQQALQMYTDALPLSEQVKDSTILTDTIFNLARVNLALGNSEAALSFIERSLEIIENLRAGVEAPSLRTLYFAGVRRHYELCVDILMDLHRKQPGAGFSERALLMSEKSRSRSLIDLVKESQTTLREGATAELLRNEREVSGLIQQMSAYQSDLSLSGRKDPTEASEVQRQMAQLNARYHEIQTQLRAQKIQKPALTDFELKDVEQVRRALPTDGTMLLEYALGNERSYLWAITSDSFQSYELPKRKDIEDAAIEVYNLIVARQGVESSSDYQAKVETADQQYADKATALSQMLLGPVVEQLGNRRLLLVREGALQLAPFDALPVPNSQAVGPSESSPYLFEKNEIVALPSMSTLLAMRATLNRRVSPSGLVAIIADPVFSPSDERVKAGSSTTVDAAGSSESEQTAAQGSSSATLARLVYASEEADAILGIAPYGSTMVAKGFEASRQTATSGRLGEYQIVHFATHGFLDTKYPALSAIVLTSVDQNGAHQNGVMPLNEIYNLDLAAELTVLSACQTALGTDIKGEGLIGLTHGFLSAGSKSVVASLWKVDDRATAALMSYFYNAMLQEKLPPSAALRVAKLKMKQDKQWSAPYYWAGFVFQGDYESRINVESNSRLVIGLVVLLLVLVSFVLLISLRRRRRSSPAK